MSDRRPMEAFDVLMYRSEIDPRARSTLLGVFLLDTTPDWDRLVEHYERVTRLIVPLRQRVVEPTVPIGTPTWAVDPNFDLAYHLRRAHVPAPGTERELLALLEPVAMAPLDHARPLWEFTLVEGLEGGRAAWVTKVNHAIADGVGGNQLAKLAFDFERDPKPADDLPLAPEGDALTPNDLVRDAVARAPRTALGSLAGAVGAAGRTAGRLGRDPAGTVSGATAYLKSLGRMMAGPGVEPSPLLRDRGLRRRLLAMEVSLDDLKAASKAAGGSLNDGVLAAVCGGLRLYHEQLGHPVESVPMAMPVSLRTSDDDSASNRWTGVRLAPPVGELDPAERIRILRQQVLEARQEPAIDAMNLMAPIAVRLPPWLLASAFGDTALPDVQVSNIPGSPVPFYLAGAEVEKVLGFGPLPGPATMITVNSYVRTLYFGINLDPDAITEPDRFLACLRAGVDEVLAISGH